MFVDGLDGSDDGAPADNFFNEINSGGNDDYHEINIYDGLDGKDDGNDNYYDEIQSEGSLHLSTLRSIIVNTKKIIIINTTHQQQKKLASS